MRFAVKVAMIILAVSLTGCGVIEDVMEDMEAIERDFEQQTGLKVAIAWNITSGQLTEVNVMFSIDDVRDRTVSELEKVSWPIIRKHFDQEPSAFLITITNQSMFRAVK
jgi:hypothetical protein